MKPSTQLNVSVDLATSNTLSLLAAANNTTLSEFAARILKERAREAHNDDAFMASLGRMMIERESIKPPEKKKKKKAPVQNQASVAFNKADGLPHGQTRTKDGRVLSDKHIKEVTFNRGEAAEALNISDHLVQQSITNGGIVPYALIGPKKYPRFTSVELAQIDKWTRTPCDSGKGYKRDKQCPVCLRYFSLQGLRLHEGTCSPKDRKPYVS